MDQSNDPSGDEIANVVLKQFDELPAKRKPLNRGEGVREWVPLSGIVASGENGLTCLSLATGMKCLPHSKLPQAQGNVIHDWHAEILCLRSFNHFLLQEILALLSTPSIPSQYLQHCLPETITRDAFQPFELKPHIKLFMYCSEAPCGDASMELTMAAQEDATPWALPPSNPGAEEREEKIELPGRANFQLLGHVRRKPSRPDAPPTLSKSCSDKLASTQYTSLLSSLTSLFISPKNIYLHSLILPTTQHSTIGFTRCFHTRLNPLKNSSNSNHQKSSYKYHEIGIKTTTKEFIYSRRYETHTAKPLEYVSSNISTSWIRGDGKTGGETLVNGALQGRKQFDVRGASRVCRRRVWKVGLEVLGKVAVMEGVGLGVVERLRSCLGVGAYKEVKGSEILGERRRIKEEVRECLGGWVRNEGDDEFEVEVS
ncbi:4c181175-502f-4b82-a424-2b5343324335 [Sclerotinia trifoliorum]|uniref:4c181175-502f-4b82-a424-2b5343324335 n=1 Tax=Sclerotinia trifoliorum TaxID=28548 RepID=A0A8H2ZQ23_9HELO|nr:4c181175-502f-4b82-a424-2b5343324335 [Sclerotinia trifoliorum]